MATETSMSATDIAAWWGAGIATLVFAWDVYKWKHAAAEVNVRAIPNMNTYGVNAPGAAGKTFVMVEAVNAGARATTLTHLVGFHYTSFWERLRRKPSTNFVVMNNSLDRQLPCDLQPGARWMGAIEQNADLERLGSTGYLFCGVIHATSKRPVLARVRITPHAP